MVDPEITLSEEAGIRYLHFGSPWIQGAMRIRRPWDIVIDYVAQMQSWLLFLDPPKHILQIGLGAAALTKHGYRYFPESHTTVVEASRAVVNAAHLWFELPANDSRLTVLVADGDEYLKTTTRKPPKFGVIQVDVYDQEARGPVLNSLPFYQNCYDHLNDVGLLSVNLFGEEASFRENLERISKVFNGRVLSWPAVDAGNIVVLAFKGPALQVSWKQLAQRAQLLDRAYDLPAPKWLRQLRRRSVDKQTSTAYLSL